MLSGTAVPAPGGSAGNSAGTKPAAQKTSFVDLAEAILAGQAAAPAPAPVRRRKAPKLSSSLSRVWGVDNLSMLDLERRNPVPPPNNGAVAGAGAAAGPAGAAALGVLQAHTAPGDNAEHDDENIDVEDELEDLQRYSLYESDLAYGLPHPDPLVQASSLANASLPPITYVPRLFTDPEVKARTIDSGALSKVQLEAVVYACQRHQKRLADGKTCAGFFVGDGAGVGKGRTIAGIIYENYLHGRRKALWISVSADLHVDAQRDLDDIGAPLNVFNIAKLPYRRIEEDEGVLFSTYSSLVAKKAKNANVGIATRLDQIVDWLGPDWDGCLIFDESHKAKNLIPAASTSKKKGGGETIDTIEDPGALSKRTDRILDAVNHGVLPEVKSKGATKTGLAVGALQERLRHARVVYVSATGVSEVRNMAYMSRMGLWGPGTHFPLGFKQFFEAVSKRGEGAMECLALDLKNMGAYVSRTLSYAGSSFEILKVETDPAVLDYDAAAKMWLDIKSLCENWADSATTGLTEKYRSVLFRMYWSAHQRFFRYLCVAAKVGSTVDLAQRALAEGKAVVIGLQNTGESSAKQRLADEPNCEELVSAPRESLVRLVLWYFGKCFVKRPEGMEDEELDLDLILDEVEDDEAGDHRITIGSDSEDGVRGKKGKIIRHARDDDSVTSGSTARRGVKSERVKNESDIDSEPKIKPEPGSDEDIDDFVVSDSVEESDSDPEVMPDDVDSDDPVPRCRRRTKSKPVQSAKAKGKQVVRDEPKPLPARRKLAPRTVRKSVPSYAEDSDADSEADEHPAPVPARAQRKKPVTVKSELKRKKPDPSIQGSKDKDESDGEIRGPIKKKMLIGDSDDEVSVRRPAAQPVQQAPVIPRRPVNLNRYLVPLYRLAGSKERVEAIPQFAALKEVLEKIEAINLPENALDQLVIALGGPSEVAELTGRKIRATISPSGTITYEKRYGPGTGLTLDNMNLKEKKAFMDGVKVRLQWKRSH